MTASQSLITPTDGTQIKADRTGVIASILCAIHCAITPILLIFAPTFAKIWAHPASHWIVAIFVVPLAVVMVISGFRKHRKSWIVAVGIVGMALVLVGAVIPYWEKFSKNSNAAQAASVTDDQSASEDDTCDSCCPSIVTDNTGKKELNIPLASIVTTLGGIFLICTHIGNICCCRACRNCKIA
jgi:hypothetical protein